MCFIVALLLTSITIPDNVKRIGGNAFKNCSNLKKITIINPECNICDSEDTISDTATIYGYIDSTAEEYAKKYDRNFVVID